MIHVGDDRLVGLLALAVVVAIGVEAVPVARRLAGGDDGVRPAGPVAAAVPPPPVDLAPLRRFAPFGTRVSPGGVPGDPGAVGLQLRGILLARPAAASVALIAAADGVARGYTVGAAVPGGAIVDAIEFDLVVLRVNGQLVTLALPARPGKAALAVPASAAAAAVAAAPDPVSAHEALDAARDPLTLLGALAATAGPAGVRVGPALSDDLRRAGLAPGDIVERVDGATIGNADHDRVLFDNAVVAGRMRVDVVRAGRPVSLTIPLH